MKRRLRQYFAALLAALMMLTLLPAAALAEGAAQPEGDVQAEEQEAPPAGEEAPAGETAPGSEDEPENEAELSPDEEAAPGAEDTPEDEAEPSPEAEEAPGTVEKLQQTQALIDALPEADSITEDTRAEVEAQLAAIDEAKLALTDGERAALDVTRYEAAAAALLALDGQDGDDVPMAAADGSGRLEYSNFTYEVTGATLTLTGSGVLDLMHEDGYPWDNRAIETVIVEGDATAIGDRCFSGWTNLRSVTLPEGVTSIGISAFDSCNDLTQLRLPDSLSSIGELAFSNCRALELTSLPANLTSIGNGAFAGCKALALTELPANLTSIGDGAFVGCEALALTELPANLRSIGDYTFEACLSLALTELPGSLETIGEHAFSECGHLALTEIPEGVTSIGGFAFLCCDGLTRLTLPASLRTMGAYVFQECKNLTSLTFLGETAPEITSNTFTLARGLQEILIPEGATGYDAPGWPQEKIRYEITVTIPDGGSITLQAGPTDTVRSVKDKIKEKEGIPAGVQRLTFNSKPLEDGQVLGDCDVAAGSTLELSLSYEPEGEGTAEEPYLIPDKDQLEAFQYYINNMPSDGGKGKYFQLTADIDLENEPWTPVGKFGTDFKGMFDGGGHTIRGVNIEGGGLNYVGFFGCIYHTTIKNVTIEGSVISQNRASYTGGIVGRNIGGTVENCTNRADLSGISERMGGVIGRSEDDGAILGCVNTGSISTDGLASYAGGIAGESDSPVENCRNEGTIGKAYTKDERVELWYVGGIVGELNLSGDETLKSCVNTGAVFGYNSVGGIAGYGSGAIADCQNSGPVSGEFYVGGIAGQASQTIQNCANTGTVSGILSAYNMGGIAGTNNRAITNCRNSGAVGEAETAGGIAGVNYSGRTVENCYNTGAVNGSEAAGGIVGKNQYSESYSLRIGTVKNCYNIGAVTCEAGSAGGIAGQNETGAVVDNCYYLFGSAAGGEGTVAERWRFDSGEIAWLLQKAQSAQTPLTWGQKLGGDAPDEYPVLSGEESDRTVRVTFLADWEPEYEARLYANPGKGVGILPEIPRAEGYVPVKWALTDAPDGEAFTGSTPVNGEMTVYAVHELSGSLTVSVTAAGDGADPDREWRFRVEIDDLYYYGDDDMLFGVAEFTLKAGESRTFAGLRPGTKYAVTELNGDQDGYAATAADASGVIVSGETATAAFTNTLAGAGPGPAEPEPSDDPGTPETPEPSETPDKPSKAPATGDEEQTALWLALMLLSLAGIIGTALLPMADRKRPAATDGGHRRTK